MFFNLLWAGINAALMVIGVRRRMRMLRGFAATFLLIQVYTLYFEHVADALGALGVVLGGVSLLALVAVLERRRRRHGASAQA